MRGSAMSGAPSCNGIIQFASPTNAGMTAPKIMISACIVVMVVEESRIDDLQAWLEELGADHHRHRAADKEHHAREHQVQRADVLVIGSKQPALDAGRLPVVVRVRGVGRCLGVLRGHRVNLRSWFASVRLGNGAGGSRLGRRRQLH